MHNQGLLFNVPEKLIFKANKKKPAELEINRINRKVARRRYYLHKQLPDDFTVFAAGRRIKCEYQSFMDIPVGPRWYVSELIKMGYEIQFKLNF
ncbi:hypothetical protein ACRQ5D_10780 [Mucilaginibacter sp. P25]|uniref:hypothetical protein n=1 Tax=Mucilaginibacter sp. P25 TaxID=3423945 RepID=UPI003D7BBA27